MTFRFGPPIDLTALAGASPPPRPRVCVFVGRVSTKDQQNPASSIPRQVVLASDSLEPGEEFAAFYWDVESGMLPPEQRGLGPAEMYAALAVPTRRDGGLQDLVERAEQLGVTHVMAERSDRLARAMLTSLTVEHALERIGAQVIYANEPTGGTESGRLRLRRYGQAEAEIFRATMLEMSTGGQVQHAVSGWNHGPPPYPYTTEVDPDAPPRPPGRFGAQRPKRRLIPHPDPRRFDAARELCRLRREEGLATGDIVAILAADPDRYPVPDTGGWTYNLVKGLAANPKLTGYQVYNRKSKRRRPGEPEANPLDVWVWSPRITHEPVITVEEWRQAQEVTAELRATSRRGDPLARIRAVAHQQGHTIVPVANSATHTLYRIGDRQIALPTPVPNALASQVIDDLRAAS